MSTGATASMTTSKKSKAIEVMEAYKGKPYAPPVIILAGVMFGFVTPNLLARCIPPEWVHEDNASVEMTFADRRVENVLLMLQAFILVAILFWFEFQCGIVARSVSLKASFSPAAAQANGGTSMPFEIVQANRIHQNQIEAACMYLPAALAATAAGCDIRFLLSTVMVWFVARLLYRWGYRQESPMWRAPGLFASYVQFFMCVCLFIYRKTMV